MSTKNDFESKQYVQPTAAIFEFKFPLCGGIEDVSNQGEDPGGWDD
jgi:hypothetical protein